MGPVPRPTGAPMCRFRWHPQIARPRFLNVHGCGGRASQQPLTQLPDNDARRRAYTEHARAAPSEGHCRSTRSATNPLACRADTEVAAAGRQGSLYIGAATSWHGLAARPHPYGSAATPPTSRRHWRQYHHSVPVRPDRPSFGRATDNRTRRRHGCAAGHVRRRRDRSAPGQIRLMPRSPVE